MIFIIASVAVGIGLMADFDASRMMIALIAAILVTLAALGPDRRKRSTGRDEPEVEAQDQRPRRGRLPAV